MKITEKEYTTLIAIAKCDYMDGYATAGRFVWTASCNPFDNARSFGGVLASLLKKGLVLIENGGDDDSIALTEVAIEVLRASGREANLAPIVEPVVEPTPEPTPELVVEPTPEPVADGHPTPAELIAQLKVEAMKRYDKGYDIVIEAMTDEEILRVIGKARTHWGALTKMAAHVRTYNSYANDIRNA